MILVQDLDLVPGFTNCHTAIRAPEMFDHAIFTDLEIPLRTRIFLGLRNSLLFFLRIPGREHPTWLLFGLAGVNAGFFQRCRVASDVFFWRCPLVILVKDPKLLAAVTNHETAVGCPDILNYAILAERKKGFLFIVHGYARRSILVSGRLLIFPISGVLQFSIAACVQRGVPLLCALKSFRKGVSQLLS